MKPSLRLFGLLATVALLVGCSSSDPNDDPEVFSGPFDGTAVATFVTTSGTRQVEFTIRIELQEPNPNTTQFNGTLRIVRRPEGAMGEVTQTGTVFGTLTGNAISISGSTGKTGGAGFGFGGMGTLSTNGATIQLTEARITDISYGGSNAFVVTLN